MTRYGSIETYDVERDLISRCLDLFGEWAWHEVAFVGSVLPPGARVLDIGAFLGTFSLGLSVSCDVGYLCAVEANPSTVTLLEKNIRENVRNAAVVVEAIVAAPGTEPRPGRAPPDNQGATSFRIDGVDEIETDRPARAVTLADLRNEYGPFDLVKIDAEGMEIEILASDSENLARGETALWLECNETPSSLNLAQCLLSWGLDVFYFAFPAHNTANYRGNAEALLPSAYEAGLLAAPRVRPHLNATLAAHGCILQQIAKVDDLKYALWRTPRWGMAEWSDATPATVIALTVHALLGEEFENYLAPAWRRGEPLWSQLAKANAAVADRTTELVNLRDSLSRVGQITRSAEAALIDIGKTCGSGQTVSRENAESLVAAEAIVTHQFDDLTKARDRRSETEATLANTEPRVPTPAVALPAIEASVDSLQLALEHAQAAAAATDAQQSEVIEQERQQRSELQTKLEAANAILSASQAELASERTWRSNLAEALQATEVALSSQREAFLKAREQCQLSEADLRRAEVAIAQHLDDLERERSRRLELEGLLIARDDEIAQARTFGDRCRAALADASALSLERLGQITALRQQIGAIRAAGDAPASDLSEESSATVAPIAFTGEPT